MNQILSIDQQNNNNINNNSKNNNNGTSNSKGIIKVLIIVLIIFALIAIGIAAYAILNGRHDDKKVVLPEITVNSQSEETVELIVKHEKGIGEIKYSWNHEDEKTIQGENRKEISTTINVPEGKNILYVEATDNKGNKSEKYKQEFKNGGMDINFDAINENVRITVESDKNISFITYRWDEEEEKRVEVNDKTVKTEVATLKGTHTLTVSAVDENNKTETATKIVVGATRPTIDVTIEENKYYVIKVTDENEIKRVEIITPEGTETKEPLEKEFEYKVELKIGDNKMIIRAYNSNEQAMAEKKVKCTIE